MTTRREVPLSGDTLAWVHSEIADLKSKLALVQQAADQSRGIAADAAEKALSVRSKIDLWDGQAGAITHLQDELRVLREQLARMFDDIHSLRQSRDESERRLVADSEYNRQDKNEIGRLFQEIQHQIESWQDRIGGFEEHNRRNLEAASQLALRIETLEANQEELDIRQTRAHAAVSRMDQDIARVSSVIPELQREDEVEKERVASVAEVLRRLESEIEAMRAETNRIGRIDDRLELVQAERSRHGERLTELTTALDEVNMTLTHQAERIALIEARMVALQEDSRGLHEMIADARDHLAAYIKSMADLEGELRKREIAALEKEVRDIRTRALHFAEE